MEKRGDSNDPSNYGDDSESVDFVGVDDFIANDDTTDGGDSKGNSTAEDESSSNVSTGGDFSAKVAASSGLATSSSAVNFPTHQVAGIPSKQPRGVAGHVAEPFLDDIIGGRGKQANKHFGNQNFRRLIRENCQQYGALSGNANKTKFVEDIVARVASTHGRFLKRKREADGFLEMNEEEAKKRVGQVSDF